MSEAHNLGAEMERGFKTIRAVLMASEASAFTWLSTQHCPRLREAEGGEVASSDTSGITCT